MRRYKNIYYNACNIFILLKSFYYNNILYFVKKKLPMVGFFVVAENIFNRLIYFLLFGESIFRRRTIIVRKEI